MNETQLITKYQKIMAQIEDRFTAYSDIPVDVQMFYLLSSLIALQSFKRFYQRYGAIELDTDFAEAGKVESAGEEGQQSQAHAQYGGRIRELQQLLRAKGLEAPAEALDLQKTIALFRSQGRCMEKRDDGPHGSVWCVKERGHAGEHAGRCMPCDLVLQALREMKK